MLSDRQDQSSARRVALAVAILGLLWMVAAVVALMSVPELWNTLNQGVGPREGAIYAFLLTTSLLVVLALVAGDGLLGEVQFLIGGFLTLFFISWPLLTFLF